VIGLKLREDQIARTLERFHCPEGTELLGIEYRWQESVILVRVKHPVEGDRRGVVRELLVPSDVLELEKPYTGPRLTRHPRVFS
jgi:hypothetical protein